MLPAYERHVCCSPSALHRLELVGRDSFCHGVIANNFVCSYASLRKQPSACNRRRPHLDTGVAEALRAKLACFASASDSCSGDAVTLRTHHVSVVLRVDREEKCWLRHINMTAMARIKVTKTRAEKAKHHCSKQGRKVQAGKKKTSLASAAVQRPRQHKGPMNH